MPTIAPRARKATTVNAELLAALESLLSTVEMLRRTEAVRGFASIRQDIDAARRAVANARAK